MSRKAAIIEDLQTEHMFKAHDFEVTTIVMGNGSPEEQIPDGTDVVVLPGHYTDVDPALYGESRSDQLGSVNRDHDLFVNDVWNYARENNIPVVGICKGAQQMCVFNGGSLIQHVPRVGQHVVSINNSPFSMEVEADHHQVMVPDESAEVLAFNQVKEYPEVLAWEDEEGRVTQVAVQYHPEWSLRTHLARMWFMSLVVGMIDEQAVSINK